MAEGWGLGQKSRVAHERELNVDPVGPNLQSETWSSGPSSVVVQTLDPNSKIDRIVALASDAIRYVDQKKI